MKITIARSTLIERLSQVAKALPSKITIPILEGALIESNAELTITCSDTNFTIMTVLDEYEKHEAGAAVIPAKKLLEVINKMPDKPIEIAVEGTQATIKCGKTVVKLPAMNAEEFPRRAVSDMNLVTIDGDAISKLVDNTAFAVSTNENTPVLQGVQMVLGGGTLTATATDRHRLARQSTDVRGEAGDGTYVVPAKVLGTVSKIKTDIVEIGLSENELHLTAGAFVYTASLLDGTYPDTSRIIPEAANITVKTDTAQLLQTLELAEKIAEGKNKVVKLEVANGELKVSAAYEESSMEETIEAEADGEIIISANCRYLIDALKCIEAKKVEIWLTGPMSPMILRGEGDESGLQLVLPYRTQG